MTIRVIFIHTVACVVLLFTSKPMALGSLVSWDFGYYGMELAESAALACILRCTLGVSVKDYSTVFNDSVAYCDSSAC